MYVPSPVQVTSPTAGTKLHNRLCMLDIDLKLHKYCGCVLLCRDRSNHMN